MARCVVQHLTLAILIPATLLLAAQWNRLEVAAALWALTMIALEIVWVPHLLRNAMPSPAMMVNLAAGVGIMAAAVVPSLWLAISIATALAAGMMLALNFRLAAAAEATALVAVLAIALVPEGSPVFPPLWLLVIVVALVVADTLGWLLTYARWSENGMEHELIKSGATLWDIDQNGRITKLTGTSLGAVESGELLAKQVHPDDIDAVRGDGAPALGGSADFRVRDGDGGWTWVREVPLRSNDSFGGRRSRVADTSSERSDTEELRGMATRDPLTNCANRSAHEAELDDRSDAERVSLVKIELDGLDAVIDTLGYDVGDRLLVACSDRIRVHSHGHHLARVGSDHFAVITDLDARGVAALASNIHEQITAPFSIRGAQATVGANIGTASLNAVGATDGSSRHIKIPGLDLKSVSHRADRAVRRARELGCGIVAFDPSLHATTNESVELAQRVVGAFRQGEIGVFHQPVFALNGPSDGGPSGDPTLVGTETLARWTHPELGVLEPGRFLSILKVGGHLRRLARIVLDDALTDLAATSESTPERFVTVNLDSVNLADSGLARWLEGRLEAHGIESSRLVVDIRAQDLVALSPEHRANLSELAHLGVRVCADRLDITSVGVGVLADLPISEVKIASTVLVEAANDPQLRSLVDAALDSARQLGLTVTAVGVEDRSALSVITELGCDRAQGHTLGRPVPIAELGSTPSEAAPAAPSNKRRNRKTRSKATAQV